MYSLNSILEEEIAKEAEELYSKQKLLIESAQQKEENKVSKILDAMNTELETFRTLVESMKVSTMFLEERITFPAIMGNCQEILKWLHSVKGIYLFFILLYYIISIYDSLLFFNEMFLS